MAKRVTPEEIVQIQWLYAKYGSFAAVGREMGRSGSTVAKYVKLKGRAADRGAYVQGSCERGLRTGAVSNRP